jgi:GAF domain-containing protein
MPIRVDGEIFGTLAFSSAQGRNRDFDPSDLEFVRLLARWAGAFHRAHASHRKTARQQSVAA